MKIKKALVINIMIIWMNFIVIILGVFLALVEWKVYLITLGLLILLTLVPIIKKNKKLVLVGLVAIAIFVLIYFFRIYCIVVIFPITIIASILFKLISMGKLEKEQKGLLFYKIYAYTIVVVEILGLFIYLLWGILVLIAPGLY